MARKPESGADSPDYTSLSIAELETLVGEITTILNGKKDERRAELLAELSSLGGVPAAPKAPRAPKVAGEGDKRASPKITHRDPATGAEWRSRGMKPKWLQAYIEQGRSADEFRVTE